MATFGNSDINIIGSWVEIDEMDYKFTPLRDGIYKGICKQLATSANINVAYANAGNVSNPQPMVLYVGYEWGKQESVAYKVRKN